MVKASLLSHGINFDIDLFKDYPGEFYDNQYVYGKTSANVLKKHRFPQVLLLGNGIITALLRRENSPWSLELEGKELSLKLGGQFVQKASLPERPAYFGKILKSGLKSESIIAVAGEDTPGFFFHPECRYFEDGSQCGFCSMKNTRSTVGSEMVSDFKLEEIAEATRIFQQTEWRKIPLISITMGTCHDDAELEEKVIEPIRAMNEALSPKIPIHLLAHPPDDFRMIEEFKKAGVTSIAFNLEVFDRKAFEQTCPGKSRLYGYDKWIKALEHARKVFGDYNAFCGLVWGLEPAESTIAGNRHFVERGIGIASNVFHADQNSVFARKPQPTADDILKIARAQRRLYLEYPKARTIFECSMRSTIDWEVFHGMIE